MLKHSRQRESIRDFLAGRCDHPTAETVYQNMRQKYPNISLGTVYRNLTLLSELGEIQKLSPGTGPDRFDANTSPHYHFICRNCGTIADLKVSGLDHINILAGQDFDGKIDGHTAYFYGTCAGCSAAMEGNDANPASGGKNVLPDRTGGKAVLPDRTGGKDVLPDRTGRTVILSDQADRSRHD